MSATFIIPQSIREISANSTTINETTSNPTSNTPSTTYTELPAQGYLARISNLPAVSAINGMISSFPVVKIFTSNAVPVLVARQERKKKEEMERLAEYQKKLNMPQ
ncbi:hypothetical protein MEW_02115 [Candida albicans P60002]|uniref:Uncharacterized protein n=2 Tax=Candida albicans TaxID=5476 RepID=Q5A2J4_CANAL|nr:uncharacterized protein CAALFM_C207700CA [Candida albicans SC5314]KGQ95769.1 hypothetical protein MEU_02167 [Candida albicans P37005]KGR13750.1 hypothetical protein MG3_02180 [Candida albicans P78048]KGU13854.1 hypothetical protein MEY_02177 [Candida albicans 19F]KHC53845.1 hypothetical protein MEW_02115 [Candida albicans P60002]KHC57878.1 hypothetical protein MGC_02164 [Candida albicans P37039]|eukprot:XP_716052.1 hypothetical protein CAALFM_C207700CA [Candida albicans SC5314]